MHVRMPANTHTHTHQAHAKHTTVAMYRVHVYHSIGQSMIDLCTKAGVHSLYRYIDRVKIRDLQRARNTAEVHRFNGPCCHGD